METKIRRCLSIACLLIILAVQTTAALAEDEPFVGEMIWVPYNFAPVGWAFCDGSTLPISGYEALFSLLGTTYGGDGVTNFALPNMKGRVMVNSVQSPYYTLGQTGGESSHTLTINEMPAHNHTFQASTATGTANTPSSDRVYGQAASGKQYGPDPSASMASYATVGVGGGQPHNNMMPYTTLNCIIALDGIYPTQP
jgi:microcystin-dependent protein